MIELFELRQTVTRLYENCLMEAQNQTGLSRGELDVLLFLANHPQYDTATDVVRVRRFSKSHVSATVEKLAQRGMLSRRVEENNRRVVRLTLQPAAQDAIAQGRRAQENFSRRLFAGISQEEQAEFARVLSLVCKNAALGESTASGATKQKENMEA